jgi:V/A-type H+-transporting ATPase subunit D
MWLQPSRSALAAMRDLEDRAGEARNSLGDAVALDGPEAVGSAALASAGEIGVELKTKSVAGVSIVELEHEPVGRSRTERGYSLSATTPRVDRTAEDFESVLEGLLDVVAVELSLRRLAEEISSTTRRVNALEHVVVPGLEEERDYIAMVLDEREMESRVRLMRAKGRSGNGKGSGSEEVLS